MPKRILSAALAASILGVTVPAHAQQAQAIPDSANNYEGDTIAFLRKTDVILLQTDNSTGKITQKAGTVCAAKGASFRGISTAIITQPGGAAGAATGELFVATKDEPLCAAGAPTISEGDQIFLTSDQLNTDELYTRRGITFGALAVPFKYELGAHQKMKPSATVGPYLGYKFDDAVAGLSIAPIVFFGASDIPISKSETTVANATDTNAFGLSGGAGFIGSIKKSFHMGAVIGWDHVDRSQQYLYSNKPWLAVIFGWSIQN